MTKLLAHGKYSVLYNYLVFIVTLSCCNLQQAHSSCHHMLPKECGFGYLHKLVLPPYAVSMPNTTLWSSCSQNRCRSATLGGKLGVVNTSSSSFCSLLTSREWGHQSVFSKQLSLLAPHLASLHVLDARSMFSLLVDHPWPHFPWMSSLEFIFGCPCYVQ